jgi:hypothetical protein
MVYIIVDYSITAMLHVEITERSALARSEAVVNNKASTFAEAVVVVVIIIIFRQNC